MELTEQEHFLMRLVQSQHQNNQNTSLRALNKFLEDHLEPDACLTDRLGKLIRDGLICLQEENYALTQSGAKLLQQLESQFFGTWMVACEQSPAYRKLSQRVHGTDLCHFDMVTQLQLDALLELLPINENTRVLDLGCGIGTLSEYISDRTGALVTGIDFAPLAIESARKRTAAKSSRLSFLVADMNALSDLTLEVDGILAFDTLYFVHDLHNTVRDMLSLLRSPGWLALFYTTHVEPDESLQSLEPDQTRLAGALSVCGLSYQTHDFTQDEIDLWQRMLKVSEELKPEYEVEGKLAYWESGYSEAKAMFTYSASHRLRRYLYTVGLR